MEGQEDGAHALERRQSGTYTLVSPIKCHDGAGDAPCPGKLVFLGKGGKTAVFKQKNIPACLIE